METTGIPSELMTREHELEPADDEVLLYPSELSLGMIVVAASYSYRRNKFWIKSQYCRDEPLGSSRPSEWCQIVELKRTSYSGYDSHGRSYVSFVGKHHDGALVNYNFLLATGVTDFIVKRSSIA